MANVTSTIAVTTTGWVQVGGVGEQIMITPVVPDVTVLIRYSVADPTSSTSKGHILSRDGSEKNSIFGSTNTDAIWARAVNKNTNVEVTVL